MYSSHYKISKVSVKNPEQFIESYKNTTTDDVLNKMGCSHIQLFQDFRKENVFTTLTGWDSLNSLNNWTGSQDFNSEELSNELGVLYYPDEYDICKNIS